MATLLYGAPVAEKIHGEIRERTERLAARGIVPCLAIVRVGAQPDDVYYEKSAAKRAEAFGVSVRFFTLAAQAAQEELLSVLEQINRDPAIHGCLLMRPLPDPLSDELARNAIRPEKDVDGVTDASLAALFTGAEQGFAPCTAEACLKVLDYYGRPLSGTRAVVIGRSLVIGKPVAMLLLARDATVTVCHTKTRDLPAVCRDAELIVAAAGRMQMVTPDHLCAGQTVLDVGIHTAEDGSLCGDVSADAASIVDALTPVPGGLGTVTTAMLIDHTVLAACRQCGL